VRHLTILAHWGLYLVSYQEMFRSNFPVVFKAQRDAEENFSGRDLMLTLQT